MHNHTKSSTTSSGLLLSALLLAGMGMSSTAYAADCKGQTQSFCEEAQSCSWIDSYERKDGRTVKAFCRTKSKGVKNKGLKAKVESKDAG